MAQEIERRSFETPFDDLDKGPKPEEADKGKNKGGDDPKPDPKSDPKPDPKGGEGENGGSPEGKDPKEGIAQKEVKQTKGTEDDGSDRNDPGGKGSGEEDDPKEKKDNKAKELSNNDVYNLAMHWKKEGYLPEDVEVDEDISDAELSELYRKSKEEPLRQEIEERRIEELKGQGYNDRDLRNAKLISQGIDPRDIIEADNFEALARVEMPEDEEQRLDMQKRLLTIDYRNQGIKDEKKIERLIDISVKEGEIDDEVDAARQRFAQTAEQRRKDQEAKVAENEKKAKERREKNVERIKNYIKEEKVGEDKFPKRVMKKVENALFKNDQVFEINGKKHRGTLWQKIQHRKKNDPDFAMKMIIRQIAAEELAPDPEDIERQHSDRLISGLSAGGSPQNSQSGGQGRKRGNPKKENATIERRSLI